MAVGISGWTGFAPLTLAKEAGIFKKNGLDVTIKKVPQASRHLAIQSGDIQCAATTVETWIVWNANGVATKQIFQLDKSYGADGMVVRNDVASIKDLKGKTVAASAPGHSPYFALAWMLKKNGLSREGRDRRQHGAGPGRAGLHRRPERCGDDLRALSLLRARRAASRQDHRHDPRLSDGDGHVRLHAEIPRRQSEGREGPRRQLFRGARDDRQGSGEGLRDHGRGREADAARRSASRRQYLRWQDRAANKKFFAGEFKTFSKEAADLLLEMGIIKQKPGHAKRSPTPASSSKPLDSRGGSPLPCGPSPDPVHRHPDRSPDGTADLHASSSRTRRPRRARRARHLLLRPVRRGLGRSRRSAASSRRPSSPIRSPCCRTAGCC